MVVARYGEIFRGDIVRNAAAAGAAGVVIYTAAEEYGGERWFPEDRWLPPSGVQVGTVYSGLGDPTTPGWPSVEGCERIGLADVDASGEVPLIPSLPVSAEDGDAILSSVAGVGPGPGVLNLTYLVSLAAFLSVTCCASNFCLLLC